MDGAWYSRKHKRHQSSKSEAHSQNSLLHSTVCCRRRRTPLETEPLFYTRKRIVAAYLTSYDRRHIVERLSLSLDR